MKSAHALPGIEQAEFLLSDDQQALMLPPEQEAITEADQGTPEDGVPFFMANTTPEQAVALRGILDAFANRNRALGNYRSIVAGRPMPGVSNYQRGERAQEARLREEAEGQRAVGLFSTLYGDQGKVRRDELRPDVRKAYDWYESNFGSLTDETPARRERERKRLAKILGQTAVR